MATHFPDSNNSQHDPYAAPPQHRNASSHGYEGGSAHYPGAQVNPRANTPGNTSGSNAGGQVNKYGLQHNPFGPQGNQYGAQDNQHGASLDPRQPMIRGGGSNPMAALTRWFVAFAMIEGLVITAVLLLWISEIITDDVFYVALPAVVIVGGFMMVSRLRRHTRDMNRGYPNSSTMPGSGIVDTTQQRDWR